MNLRRQSDIINGERLSILPILIVGAGSIGSFTAMALSKMGTEMITLVDFDKVENHNIPNQLYKTSSTGENKVSALADIIEEFTGSMVNTRSEKFTPDHIARLGEGCVVIAAADNMAVRKEIYEAVRKSKDKVQRYIDARMATLAIEVYNIDPKNLQDCKIYEEHLFPDSEAVDIPCTQRGIVYPVMTCAAVISNCVRNVVMDRPAKRRYVMDYGLDMFATID